MIIKRHESEKGQVLIILTIGIVALLGLAALALDGGMFYADRRSDQNAADSSALAAAGAAGNYLEQNGIHVDEFLCSAAGVQAAIQAAETAAIQRAALNNFSIDGDISDGNGVQVSCEDAGGSIGKYLDMKVMITTQTQTTFAGLVFGGKLQNVVEAVSRVQVGDDGPFAGGYAIVALRDTCNGQNGGALFDGSANVIVEVGGVFSNACLIKNGDADVISDFGFAYITEFLDHGTAGSVIPLPGAPLPVEDRMVLEFDPPNCDNMTDQGSATSGGTIEPGIYSRINLTAKKTLIMNPGLYCLDGIFQAEGGTILVGGGPNDGVTIYLRGTHSDFHIAGNVHIELRAPGEGSLGVGPAIPGMLIYMEEGHDNDIWIRGNSDSTYCGTVYAPTGTIDVGGNSSAMGALNTQFIGDTVKVHGNPELTIFFQNEDIYNQELPTTVELYK